MISLRATRPGDYIDPRRNLSAFICNEPGSLPREQIRPARLRGIVTSSWPAAVRWLCDRATRVGIGGAHGADGVRRRAARGIRDAIGVRGRRCRGRPGWRGWDACERV